MANWFNLSCFYFKPGKAALNKGGQGSLQEAGLQNAMLPQCELCDRQHAPVE